MGKAGTSSERRTRGRLRRFWKTLARGLLRAYYAFKYIPFRPDRLGRAVPKKQRGFVCIQIDGLAYDHLLLAMNLGFMRHLRRWVRRGTMELHRYRPGLPTSTPYAQAGILFGVENNIPGFRWYERELGRVINCNEPSSVQFIRDEIVGDRRGALEGGSSYANFLDGGAARLVFTLAGTHDTSILGRLGGRHLLFLVVFHPIRVLRAMVASFWEFWAEIYDRWLRPDPQADRSEREGLFPLRRIGSNVLLRELQTFGLLADIHAGVPYIYTVYSGYDELAHHFGPTSRAALTNLRHIDRRIAEVWRMIRLGAPRPYDLIILSDHGQTAAIPFVRRFGRTLGEDIAAHLETRPARPRLGPEERPDERAGPLAREVEDSRLGRLPGVAPAARAMESHVQRQAFLSILRSETVYVNERIGAVVTYSSCLAHLYLLADGRVRMDHDRIVGLHPRLIAYLRKQEGIGPFFVRKSPGMWLVMEGESTAEFRDGRIRCTEGLDPLRLVDPNHESLGVLWRFLNFPNGGDVILFGRYDGGRVICFDDQVGAHSSLGGPQDKPFIMLPAGHPANGSGLNGYGAIYRDVLRPYTAQASGEVSDSHQALRGAPSGAWSSGARHRGR